MPLASPAGMPHPFSTEIVRMVRAYDASRPRSLQTFLGPSEIGAPCMRQLAYKLAGLPPVNEVADPWFAIIGSAVHAWLDPMITWYNDDVLGRKDNPRFLAENRVHIRAKEGDYHTSGKTDVYDVDNARVVDWKIVGTTTMRKVDIADPMSVGQQYYVQGQTYGEGWVQAGYPVKEVMIAMLPRSNFLNKMKLVTMPFVPGVAAEAQARVAAIDRLRQIMSIEQIPAAGCSVWCPYYRPKFPLGATSCPGHGEVNDE
jgi:hypothetical protein